MPIYQGNKLVAGSGVDGVSPIVSISSTNTERIVNITDAEGLKSFTIPVENLTSKLQTTISNSDDNIPTSGAVCDILGRSNAVSAANTSYTTLMVRGSTLNSAETNPAVNGAIAWTYE